MWNRFVHWIHHMLDPHCEECIEMQIEQARCRTCEVLKTELENAHALNRELLDSLTDKKVEEPIQTPEEPLAPKFVPWTVKRQMLERENRKANQLRKEFEKSLNETEIDDLEKEMDIAGAQHGDSGGIKFKMPGKVG